MPARKIKYNKAVSLAYKFGAKEKGSCLYEQQSNHNMTSEAIKEYWERSVYLPFVDAASAAMRPRFSQ